MPRIIGLFFFALVAFGGGGVAGPALAWGDPRLDEAFGMYSFTDASCSTVTDPVTVVFTNGNGYWRHVFDHARRSDHGKWSDSGGGQYFWDTFGCSRSDGSAATAASWKPVDRWHMRWEVAATSNAGQAYAATPHRDRFDYSSMSHCIDTYGFINGRSEILYQWYFVGLEHPGIYWSYWGNDLLIWKCGSYAGNLDGYVVYVDMRGNDAY